MIFVSNNKAASSEAVPTGEGMTTKQYRLGSAEMISAPGLIKWAMNGARFRKDRTAMVNVVVKTWGVPEDAATALLLEQVPYTVEDEAVVFTY
jgi:hypothetical protein